MIRSSREQTENPSKIRLFRSMERARDETPREDLYAEVVRDGYRATGVYPDRPGYLPSANGCRKHRRRRGYGRVPRGIVSPLRLNCHGEQRKWH